MSEKQKKSLRTKMNKKLATISEEDRRDKSGFILAVLKLQKVYQDSKTVMAYASFGAEVETARVLETILKDGKTLVLPRLNADKSLSLHRVSDMETDLELSAFGIREPRTDLPHVELKDIPLVIIPGLAFDELGNRLGRGLGCYDRLIAASSDDNTFIGLAFDAQVVSVGTIPTDTHDMAVDIVLTESKLFEPATLIDAALNANTEEIDENAETKVFRVSAPSAPSPI